MSIAISTGVGLAIAGAAGAGASIYGAHKASSASKKAAEQQAAAGRAAAALQTPYRETGAQGLTSLAGLLGVGGGPGGAPGAMGAGLEQSPGYQFRLNEGLKALQRSAAARGTLLTGGTLKGLERYAQDYASGEYDKRVNQLGNLAGMGQRAAESSGELLTGIGNAQAAGTVASGNAWQQGMGQAGNLAQMYFLSRLYRDATGVPRHAAVFPTRHDWIRATPHPAARPVIT